MCVHKSVTSWILTKQLTLWKCFTLQLNETTSDFTEVAWIDCFSEIVKIGQYLKQNYLD